LSIYFILIKIKLVAEKLPFRFLVARGKISSVRPDKSIYIDLNRNNKMYRLIFALLVLSLSTGVNAQNMGQQCSNNIELLRRDLISMLNKTAAMPPVAQVYVAAKTRYDDLKAMESRRDFASCVTESERVLRTTKPYGSR
jgi:hypothetical protein